MRVNGRNRRRIGEIGVYEGYTKATGIQVRGGRTKHVRKEGRRREKRCSKEKERKDIRE